MPYLYQTVKHIQSFDPDKDDTYTIETIDDADVLYQHAKYRQLNLRHRLNRIYKILEIPAWSLSAGLGVMLFKWMEALEQATPSDSTLLAIIVTMLIILIIRVSAGNIFIHTTKHIIMKFGMKEDYNFIKSAEKNDKALTDYSYRSYYWKFELSSAINNLASLYIDKHTYTLHHAYEFIDIDASNSSRLVLKIPSHITYAYNGTQAEYQAVKLYEKNISKDTVVDHIFKIISGIMPVIEHRERKAAQDVLRRLNTTQPDRLVQQLETHRDLLIDETTQLNQRLSELSNEGADIVAAYQSNGDRQSSGR